MKRKDFGKPCTFVDIGPEILFEIDPNPAKKNEYIKLRSVDREIDNSEKMCAHEINTVTRPTENRGMSHKEGGWPASVDNEDKESMARFRKNIEKDKHYINTIKSLSHFTEYFIKENTSIDVYEEYFETERIKSNTKWSLSANSIFQDLNSPSRSVIDISWEKSSTKFAAVYSPKKNINPVMPSLHSYVWDVVNNVKPLYIMKPEIIMSVVEFSPFNSNLILSGYISGQVALWDIRLNGYAQQLSPLGESHRNKITGIKWLKSKQDTEFFSGASDGQLISWDCRNLSAPTQITHLDWAKDHIPNLKDTYSISCVEYDTTLPYKFMIGSEQGCVLSFNRKYKKSEDKLGSIYHCGSGPVLNVERNAFFPQIFLSCDVWSLRMWSEDVTDNPILNIVSQDGYYTDTAWSATRASTIFAAKTTGMLEIWDIPGKIKEPLLNVKLENESLLSVAVAESGNYVTCGALSGSIQLLTIPEHLRSSSETEKDYLKGCIAGSEEIIGGDPRSERISVEVRDVADDLGIDEEWWDPPEKAEDMYYQEEYKNILKDDDDDEVFSRLEKVESLYDEKRSQEFAKDGVSSEALQSHVKVEDLNDEKENQEFTKHDFSTEALPPSDKSENDDEDIDDDEVNDQEFF